MLEHDDRRESFAALIDSFPCQVQLPPEERANFEKRGTTPAANDERRRYQRVHCRSFQNRAGLQYQSALPSLQREASWHNVYIANVSRDGIAFLHSEQLYPREQMRMLLRSGQMLSVEVVDCRRMGPACFEIGAHVSAGQNTDETVNEST
ncbi:MAG TPA: hypothetical protein VFE46_14930 [Pirellulales bacterium]|jgi:hypothetical protein|nr:hypothetical protein [Pirellulales bacterium]